MTTIAVTGATGSIGRLTADLLTGAGLRPRLLAPRPQRLDTDLPTARCDYADGSSVRAALAGVDVALFVSGREDADRLSQHRTFVDAARDAGVQHLVYTSFVGASPTSGFTLGHDHAATEASIVESGLTATFLRDNFYAEVFGHFADGSGAIRGPAGRGRVAAVSQRDVAAVAAHVLGDPARHADATYDLTGPEALSLDEIAAHLSAVTGRPHRFVDETLDEARASRAGHGAPDWQVDAWISTYTAIRDGELAAVSGDVERLLGRPALTFRDALVGTDA
ncbi:NmrA family protein [Aeromicrobium marinum DSM 15272]|uniref:NmrA family protein n=1 Tax=Aeromicrobium marinum DSM 15272 TaxID=585531 RepID=E2S8J4_9ACTN|nr:SDR family oxidoreductase [Aeromicrobium marinum]EFQ84499.1 NmrA family protein [Aeromicrobium marinum DSM 15272]